MKTTSLLVDETGSSVFSDALETMMVQWSVLQDAKSKGKQAELVPTNEVGLGLLKM